MEDQKGNTDVSDSMPESSKKGKSFKCPECYKIFGYKHHLNDHMRIHTGEKPYQCKVCEKSFTMLGHLKRHERTHTGDKPYQCEDCKQCFADSRSFLIHKRTHTGEKPYHCQVCQKNFNSPFNLRTHLRVHTGEKPYACETCQKSFRSSSDLTSHSRIHAEEKPYQCEVCKSSFSNSYHLKRHELAHDGDKSHQCEVCKKFFSDSSALNVHKSTHEEEKPCQGGIGQKDVESKGYPSVQDEESRYQCQVFQKDLSSCLDSRTCSGSHTGEKVYQCEVCKSSFSNLWHLKRHERTHPGYEPHQCKVCKKSFTNLYNLTIHERTHTGEKPYQCKVCQKNFNSPSNLTRHKRTHTGEKPYQCEYCEKSFSDRSTWKKHSRLHGKAESCEGGIRQEPFQGEYGKEDHVDSDDCCEEIHHSHEDRNDERPVEDECYEDIAMTNNERIQIDTKEFEFVPVDDIKPKVENLTSLWPPNENENISADRNLDNKTQVLYHVISNMIDKLTPVQRQICHICLNQGDNCNIRIPELIADLEKSFISESKDDLTTHVIHMLQNFVGSDSLNLLISNEHLEMRHSGDNDISHYKDMSIELNPVARSIFKNMKKEPEFILND